MRTAGIIKAWHNFPGFYLRDGAISAGTGSHSRGSSLVELVLMTIKTTTFLAAGIREGIVVVFSCARFAVPPEKMM